MPEHLTAEKRAPAGHGAGHQVTELVDLGKAVARIERVTYVSQQWTTLTLMIPADHAHQEPGGSLCLHFTAEQLKRFVETLAWPT